MGITTIKAKVFNPADLARNVELVFTVDSGAGYSLVPERVLQELKIVPHKTESFFLANGDEIQRKMGIAGFEYLGEITAAPVIFGEEGDAAHNGRDHARRIWLRPGSLPPRTSANVDAPLVAIEGWTYNRETGLLSGLRHLDY